MKSKTAHYSIGISRLILGYIRGELSEQESKHLADWMAEDERNRVFFEQITSNPAELAAFQQSYGEIDTDAALTRLRERIKANSIDDSPLRGINTDSSVDLWTRRKLWRKIAAAVVVITIIGATIFFVQSYFGADTDANRTANVNELPPGGNRAMLTLADGSVVDLSADKDGIIVKGNSIAYNDGTPLWKDRPNEGELTDHLAKLTLTTPRGGQYKLILPDGTKVWLNAATSLRYPEVFDDNRMVELLDGEAYFEVSHDAHRPFIVKSTTQYIEVLGTKFNLRAYQDDNDVRTTLVEGAVRVASTTREGEIYLKPGQQSVQRLENSAGLEVYEADLEEAIAWKEGYFKFNDESLSSIMKKIARWYDVEIHYETQVSPDQVFMGRISRYAQVTDVLELLELTGGVRFKIEERRINVME